MVTRNQGWLGLSLSVALATIAPFLGSVADKLIAAGAASALTTLPVLAAKEDPRQKRREKAGQILLTESGYIGAATQELRRPQVLISAANQSRLALPGSCEISKRDLTEEIARYDGHVLIASRTRSGKSTSIQSAIVHCYQHYQGNVEFFVFDPKGAAWCGIQAFEKRYLLCNTEASQSEVLSRLNSVLSILELRQTARVAAGGHWSSANAPHPIVVIVDEFNTLLALAKESKLDTDIKRRVQRIIFQGAEDKVFVWLMAQTTRVEDLGLNTAVQDNLAYFAQGRNNDLHSVEDAIANPYVISSNAERKRLQETLSAYKSDPSYNKEIPIVFSNLGGAQLCVLPDLRRASAGRIAIDIEAEVEPVEPAVEPAEPLQPKDSEPKTGVFTKSKLTKEQARSLISTLRTELTQTQIIEKLWDCTKGGSRAYEEARKQYRQLMGE